MSHSLPNPALKIMQRNLNRSTFVAWEMKRDMTVVRLIVATRSSGPPGSGKIIKEMLGSIASGTPYIIQNWEPCFVTMIFTFFFGTVHFNIIVQYKPTKCTFSKFIFQFFISSTRFETEGSSSGRRLYIYKSTHSSTYKTAFTDAPKTHCTIPLYITVFLKMNPRVRNM
jgi:hypothetical protein